MSPLLCFLPDFPSSLLFLPPSPLDSHQCDLTLVKGADFSQIQALYTTHALSSLHKEGFADGF